MLSSHFVIRFAFILIANDGPPAKPSRSRPSSAATAPLLDMADTKPSSDTTASTSDQAKEQAKLLEAEKVAAFLASRTHLVTPGPVIHLYQETDGA